MPGPIGVHESAPKPSGVSARSSATRCPGRLVELGEHVGTRPRAPRVDEHLVDLAERVLHVGQVLGRRVVDVGAAEQPPLDVREVRDLVLHRPSRALGRALPVGVVELRAELVDGAPHLVEAVDEVLISVHAHSPS